MIEIDKVYNMDCINLMREMANNGQQADLLLTDIPYNEVNRSDNGLRTLNKNGADIKTERVYVIGGLELNEDTMEFTVDGNPVKLTPIEFKILALLMRNAGRVFSSEEIYERVWNEKAINTDTIMVHVRNIRDKIEINPKEPKYLKVVWGVGYKIEKQ